MPSKPLKKLDKTKTVHVKAHERVIESREYYFICKECNRDVVRESFGGRPLYCERCHPPKPKTQTETKQQKKLPRPVLVQSDTQSKGNRAASG